MVSVTEAGVICPAVEKINGTDTTAVASPGSTSFRFRYERGSGKPGRNIFLLLFMKNLNSPGFGFVRTVRTSKKIPISLRGLINEVFQVRKTEVIQIAPNCQRLFGVYFIPAYTPLSLMGREFSLNELP